VSKKNLIIDKKSITEFSEKPFVDLQLPETTYEIFQRAATKYPDNIALTFIENGDVNSTPINVSYGALLEKINQAGNLFRSLGIGVNDVVSILLPKRDYCKLLIKSYQLNMCYMSRYFLPYVYTILPAQFYLQ
jgi:acyl-CoA synthetase (AMP-forming)/AMP-acid ligase II